MPSRPCVLLAAGAPNANRSTRRTSTAVGAAVDLDVGVAEVEPDARQVAEHAVARGARLARAAHQIASVAPPRPASPREAVTSHHHAARAGRLAVRWIAPARVHLP